jgi:hypothetical protein
MTSTHLTTLPRLITEKREEHDALCELIAEDEFENNYHEQRDKLWSEIQDLEMERAEALAGEAAVEFLREWGNQIAAELGPGFPSVLTDLSRFRERIADLDKLVSTR